MVDVPPFKKFAKYNVFNWLNHIMRNLSAQLTISDAVFDNCHTERQANGGFIFKSSS